MAWSPVMGLGPQYQKTDGTLASGYYLKFYQEGTTTAFSMATSDTGGTTLAKAQINSAGYPINGSGDPFIPHVDQDYKVILYKNATDADNDTTANAEWVYDNIPRMATANEIATSDGNSYAASITAAKALTSADLTTDDFVVVTDESQGGVFAVRSGNVSDNGWSKHPLDDDPTNVYIQRILSGMVDIRYFGAIGDGAPGGGGTINDAAFTAALANTDSLFIPNVDNDGSPSRYRITSTISIPGNFTLMSNGAVINKEFDGIGIEFVGGGNYSQFVGYLVVEGVGSHASNTALASTATTSHGIKVTGSRMRVSGFLVALSNQGWGIVLESNSGNSNGNTLHELVAQNNGMGGIKHTSTQDDCAVWNFTYRCRLNRLQGVLYEDSYLGRAHNGSIYTEGNCIDSTVNAGTYIGKLRNSQLFIYAEETVNSAPRAIQIYDNCVNVLVFDTRQSKTTVSPTATFNGCKVIAGGEDWAGGQGSEAIHGRLKMADANDSSTKWSDYVVINADSNEVGRIRFKGNGEVQFMGKDPTSTYGTKIVMSQSAAIRGDISPDNGTSAETTHYQFDVPTDSTEETSMWLLVKNNGTTPELKKVYQGAVDSSRSGYRLLEVQN